MKDCNSSQPKVKNRFTWNPNNNPNRLSRFLIRKPDIFAANPNKKPFPWLLLSFLIPFLGIGLLFLISSIYVSFQPSAHEGFRQSFSMLKSDAYHQYFPFFKDFRQKLLNGDSLLYAWNIGMGIDYLGLYSYYLGSPLNLFSVLIPEKWLIGYFTFLTPLRLGFAGLFFALMLKKLFNKNDLSIVLFSSFYATCAWVFGYSWNTMWLDTFALLPLVVLGTIQLLQDRKYVLYTVSLFFSVVINYYIGFFVCIFTLLVFICYQVCRWQSFKRFLADLGLMAVFTILALGATAIITLPTYASLLTTSAGTHIDLASKNAINMTGSTTTTTAAATTPSSSFKLNMTDKETVAGFGSFANWIALVQAMIHVGTNTFSFAVPNSVATEGLPNIYCGVFASIFVLLYITCHQIRWRDRICGLLLLLFLNLSFVIDALNYIWHGFHDTNMIPYRFSFIYSFVMLLMAYRVWILRNRIRTWQVISAGVVLLLSLLISREFANFLAVLKGGISLGTLLSPNTFFPFVNIALLLAYLIGLLCITLRKLLADTAQKKDWFHRLRFQRAFGSLLLVVVISGELILNILFFGVTNTHYVDVANYPAGTSDTAAVVNYMEENDKELFYRTETTYTQTLNDSALIGYNGITTFTSSANANTTKYMSYLGYSARENWNRYSYEDSSPINNLFLNVRYLIERNTPKETPYFTSVYQSGDVHLLKNNYYLPIGFMVDPQLTEIQLSDTEPFSFQSKFLSAALGKDVTPWTLLDGSSVNIVSSGNINISNIAKGEHNICKFSTGEKSGCVDCIYTIEQEGFLNLYINVPKYRGSGAGVHPTIRIYIDRGDGLSKTPFYEKTYNLPYTLAIGQVHPGNQIHIVIECPANISDTSLNVCAAFLDPAVMDYAHETFSRSTLKLTQFEDTVVSGTIQCEKAGLLYTSIPQNNDNWHVYVDGKEAEITLIGNAMIGVMLEEGNHTITFRYENKAFQVGLITSIVCVILFSSIVLTDLLIRRKRQKKTDF